MRMKAHVRPASACARSSRTPSVRFPLPCADVPSKAMRRAVPGRRQMPPHERRACPQARKTSLARCSRRLRHRPRSSGPARRRGAAAMPDAGGQQRWTCRPGPLSGTSRPGRLSPLHRPDTVSPCRQACVSLPYRGHRPPAVAGGRRSGAHGAGKAAGALRSGRASWPMHPHRSGVWPMRMRRGRSRWHGEGLRPHRPKRREERRLSARRRRPGNARVPRRRSWPRPVGAAP